VTLTRRIIFLDYIQNSSSLKSFFLYNNLVNLLHYRQSRKAISSLLSAPSMAPPNPAGRIVRQLSTFMRTFSSHFDVCTRAPACHGRIRPIQISRSHVKNQLNRCSKIAAP